MPPAAHGLDDLARRLPFAVDDYEAAGRALAAWRLSGREADREPVMLWVYCYVQRHLYARFARERTGSPSDVDDAVGRTFAAVFDNLHRIDDPARFAHYVSVICKRAVWRHRERRGVLVEADEMHLPGLDDEASAPFAPAAVRADVEAALTRLPPSVAEVARLRVLDGLDYEAIAARTGRPIASVRTYFARAGARLREDPRLRAHYFDDVLPPMADGASADQF